MIRICGARVDKLAALGNEMKAERRARGDGVAADIAIDGAWSEHHAAIERFVATHAVTLAAARQLGASITIDVAIEESGAAYQVVRAEPALLRLLAAAGIGFEVTVYATSDSGSDSGT